MQWLWVACGGAIGATARYAISYVLLPSDGHFPWATWGINLLGCFLAGIFLALSQYYPSLTSDLRLFFVVGILGGFTTFSSFGLETFQLLQQQQVGLAIMYLLSSLCGGVILLAIGFYFIQFLKL